MILYLNNDILSIGLDKKILSFYEIVFCRKRRREDPPCRGERRLSVFRSLCIARSEPSQMQTFENGHSYIKYLSFVV